MGGAPVQPGPEQQDAPLTEEERKLLVRLLSDPTYFPVEFRTWIRTYIESSGITLPASSIVGGTGTTIINLPAGVILPYAGNPTAANVLPCDGRSLLRDDYKALFAAIGVLHGSVDATHFNIPDYRDRSLFGEGSQVGLAGTDGRAAGSRGGPRHHHAFDQTSDAGAAHSHGMNSGGAHSHPGSSQVGSFSSPTGQQYSDNFAWVIGGPPGGGDHAHTVNPESSHTHRVRGDTSGGFDQDRVSFAGVKYVITTGV